KSVRFANVLEALAFGRNVCNSTNSSILKNGATNGSSILVPPGKLVVQFIPYQARVAPTEFFHRCMSGLLLNCEWECGLKFRIGSQARRQLVIPRCQALGGDQNSPIAFSAELQHTEDQREGSAL